MRKSLGKRLTLLYVGLTASSLLVVFFVTYFLIRQNLLFRLDEELQNESAEFAALVASQGQDLLPAVLDEETISEGTDTIFMRVVDSNGGTVYASNMASWPDIAINAEALAAACAGEFILETIRVPAKDSPVRVIYAPFPKNNVLQMGRSLGDDTNLLGTLWIWFSVVLVIMLLVSAIIGWLMARRATSGLRAVGRTALSIAKGNLDERVAISGHDDEVADLARTFNSMLDRIQNSLNELLEVTDDVAHDLRSPIMRIRGEAEGALMAGANAPAMETLAGNILEECDSLLVLINTMLEISETEAGGATFEHETFDLAIVAHDVCDMYQAVAEDRGLDLTCDARHAPVSGDRRKLMRAIVQLVDNAVKYSQSGGRIRVEVTPDDDGVRVTVHDTGPGIPPADRDQIFSRFYRVERSRNAPGNGLGLSLAMAIVHAHGGDIRLDTQLDKGSTFIIQLPAAPAP